MKYLFIILGLIIILLVFFTYCAITLVEESLLKNKNKKQVNKKKKVLFNYSETATKKKKQNKVENIEWLNKVSFEKVEINSYGLKLVADLFENKSDRWVIMIHGYLGKKEEMLHMSKYYYDRGYNVLLPDLRCHGESEGTYIGMGYTDRLDILNWIKYITDKNKSAKIILHGHSMGAATTLFAAGERPNNLICCIADSSYTSVYDIFASQLKVLYQLPSFPILNISSFIFKTFYDGYNLKKASALDATKNINVPVLFIHGTKDSLISYKNCDKLYDICKAKKDKRFFEADHAQSELEDEEKYFHVIFEFIDENTK